MLVRELKMLQVVDTSNIHVTFLKPAQCSALLLVKQITLLPLYIRFGQDTNLESCLLRSKQCQIVFMHTCWHLLSGTRLGRTSLLVTHLF